MGTSSKKGTHASFCEYLVHLLIGVYVELIDALIRCVAELRGPRYVQYIHRLATRPSYINDSEFTHSRTLSYIAAVSTHVYP